MSIHKDLSEAWQSYNLAHKLIVKHKLWFYIIAPGIINVIVFFATYKLAMAGIDTIIDMTIKKIDMWSHSITWIKPLLGAITFTLELIFRFLFFIIYISIYKNIILVFLSPVLALLSERTEKILTGKEYPFEFLQFIKDIGRGLKLALRNLFIEIFLWIVLLIVAFIPILNLLSPLVIFITSSYFTGFSMMDYYNERKKFTMRMSINIINLHRWKAISNGILFYALFAIPFVGWIISPSYAVVAATIVRHKMTIK